MLTVRSSSHGALLSLHIIFDVYWIQSYSGQLRMTAKRCKELKIVPDQAIQAHIKLKCPWKGARAASVWVTASQNRDPEPFRGSHGYQVTAQLWARKAKAPLHL